MKLSRACWFMFIRVSSKYICVVVNFLSQVILIFLLFQLHFFSIHNHTQKQKKTKITCDKKLTTTYIYIRRSQKQLSHRKAKGTRVAVGKKKTAR